MKLFISGPMRGIPYYNFPAFDAARAAFEAVGFEVVTPADLDRAIGFDAIDLPADTDWRAEAGLDVRAAMKRNIDALLDCDGVVFLAGSNDSIGCAIERAISARCGMQTITEGWYTIPELVLYVQKNWTACAGKGEA
jgi:hypothetical protein